MIWWRNQGLRFKIAIVITFTLIVGLGAVFFALYRHINTQFWTRETQQADNLNKIVATLLQDAMMVGRKDQIQNALVKVGENASGQIDAIAIFDDNSEMTAYASGFAGGRIIDQKSLGEGITDPNCWICHQLPVNERPTAIVVNIDGEDVIRNNVPLYNEPRCQTCHGTGKSVLGDSMVDYRLDRYNQDLLSVSLGLAGAALIAAVLVALALYVFLNRLVISPLGELQEETQAVVEGDLSRHAPVHSEDEVGRLADAFNRMTEQLRSLVGTLEQRVADRTRALETSTEVSRRLSTILDQQELVAAVVEDVQRAFGYYHAHIYLLDDEDETLHMVGGTGEAGQIMLAREHKIPMGRGLVGRSAVSNEVVLVLDTSMDPGWLPNPLLPDTKSEVAVPIAIGDRVYGVLDVQHNVADGLTKQDADLLRSVANQVAVAVQNANLFTQTQRKAEQETLVNVIGQRIQTATSVEDVMQVALRELSQALDVKKGRIQIGSMPNKHNGRSVSE
jgi:putative methionine-R-sulfoxide reductase with GAF domain